MKKKIFTLVLIIVTCIGTLSADIVRVVAGGIYYNLDRENMTAEVTYQSIRNVANIDYVYNEYNQIQIANIPNVIIYNDSSYNVTSIGEGAFSGCIYLKSVTLPSSLNKIGVKAFRNSYKLTSIEIPDNVTTIEDQAFGGDFKLESVIVGLNVTSCAGSAFNECTGLRTVIWNAIDCKSASLQGTFLDSVVLGNQVRTIPSGFCAGRTGLNKINIPNSVTNIGSSAFYGTGLTSINIPNSVISIGSYAFSNCQSLTSMTIPSSVKKIGEGTFSNSHNITSLSIGNNVDSIGYQAFSDCSGLISLDIPNSVKFIGGRAFYGCTSLTSLTIGENVDSIGDNFLASCSNLKSVVWNAKDCADFNIYNGPQPPFYDGNNTQSKFVITFGENVMHIPALLTFGPTAYYRLDTVICLGSIPASLGQDALDDVLDNNNCYIYVPCGTKNAYKQAWPKYASRITSSNSCPPEEENTYYTVTFKDWDGTVLKTEQVEEGQSATAPANPTRYGYTFTGWDNNFSNVQSDLIITAQYTQNPPSITYYTVTFKDWNGTVLKTEQVEEGHSATAPANPTRDGYTFTGWDKDFSNVQSNLIVTAVYEKDETPVINAITVRLKASSASSWSKVNLYYWADGVASPAWPGITINRDADGWYSHTFDASVTSVNIIWNDGNNQTADITNVTESTCYSLKSTSGKTIGVNVVECQAAAPISVTGVSLNKKTLQMVVGNTATLTASVLPANASNKSVTWTSSNTATATVSSTGTISAKAEGVTTITCKTVDGNFTAECYVVVSEANSEYTFSYEPTNATVINYTATELSYNEIPENNCVFAALADNAHTLHLMYVGSLVNGKIPQGNYKITSTLQSGTFCYSVGGDDQYDYGSYMATDFDSEGYYTSAYYIIAGDITIGSKNNYTVKVVSANGTDINVTYAGTQDVEIVPSEIKASKILRNGQIYILRGEKIYTITGLEVQ